MRPSLFYVRQCVARSRYVSSTDPRGIFFDVPVWYGQPTNGRTWCTQKTTRHRTGKAEPNSGPSRPNALQHPQGEAGIVG